MKMKEINNSNGGNVSGGTLRAFQITPKDTDFTYSPGQGPGEIPNIVG